MLREVQISGAIPNSIATLGPHVFDPVYTDPKALDLKAQLAQEKQARAGLNVSIVPPAVGGTGDHRHPCSFLVTVPQLCLCWARVEGQSKRLGVLVAANGSPVGSGTRMGREVGGGLSNTASGRFLFPCACSATTYRLTYHSKQGRLE
ncbi:hypothetical protein B0T21DRAFT_74944 [Apiosordaria backusii]|uniref:Uncharacterized protein n=1 Tax=Apiosordaria backusii TaxID=314023 RepID=A0AA40AAD4_9PEZI|nr:hypothetical protein B0T21DRAFT_74944 [Apiosordaria backusii]